MIATIVVAVVLQIHLDHWKLYFNVLATFSTLVGAPVCILIMYWSTQRVLTNECPTSIVKPTAYIAEECSRSQHCVAILKDLPMLKLTGPIKAIYETEHRFIRLLLSNKAEEVTQAAKMIIKSNSISVDVKVIAECYQASSMATFHEQDSYAEPLFKNALAKASQMECINGLLLQGRVLRHYATLLRGWGEYKRAQECIRGAKQKLFNAAPSFERASVLLQDIQLQLDSKQKGTPLDQKAVERDYDQAVYCMDFAEEHEKPGLCICLTRKAGFHLRSYEIGEKLPPEKCRPTLEDMNKAKSCLDSVPLDVLPNKNNYYVAEYYLTLSDFHLWQDDYCKATEFAKKAKQQFVQGNITNERSCIPDKRIMLLKRLEDQKKADKELHQILEAFST